MARLNKNNFLRWDGAFNAAPAVNVANNDTATMRDTDGNVKIDLLLNDISTFGIDFTSIVVTVQDNPGTPATWNPSTKQLTYFWDPLSPIGTHIIKYKWNDVYGNSSNEASVAIEVTRREKSWVGYNPSFSCINVLAGDHRGYYAQLQQVYSDDNQPVTPANIKDNLKLGLLAGQITAEGVSGGYVDVNLSITVEAVPKIELYTIDYKQHITYQGAGVRVSMDNVYISSAPNPWIHLQLYKNGTLVYQKSLSGAVLGSTYYDLHVDANANYLAKAWGAKDSAPLPDINIADTYSPAPDDSIIPADDPRCYPSVHTLATGAPFQSACDNYNADVVLPYYAITDSLTLGFTLYTDEALTTKVGAGIYSDGINAFQTDVNGLIVNVTPCGS